MRIQRNCLIPKAWDFQPTTIGEHIKRRRLELGLYQKDVAKFFGITLFTIINWEKGRTKPTVKLVPSLIQFLGYDPAPPERTTSLADRLKARRRELGLGQRETAQLLGVGDKTVNRWEAGGAIQGLEQRELVTHFLERRI
ncbi:MAG: helix-turn-helix domain-containing protein [Gammaproteobacteria bacterium]|nr:helix-turn-helix domain-containing protein [Gammaproteobacteria bacterium]